MAAACSDAGAGMCGCGSGGSTSMGTAPSDCRRTATSDADSESNPPLPPPSTPLLLAAASSSDDEDEESSSSSLLLLSLISITSRVDRCAAAVAAAAAAVAGARRGTCGDDACPPLFLIGLCADISADGRVTAEWWRRLASGRNRPANGSALSRSRRPKECLPLFGAQSRLRCSCSSVVERGAYVASVGGSIPPRSKE